MESLPDAVLGAILGLAGPSAGPACTLVCTRWRRLFFCEPTLWRSFKLAPGPEDAGSAWLAAKHAVFARVAGMVEHLAVQDFALEPDTELVSGRWQLAGRRPRGHGTRLQLAAFLSLLEPERLTGLRFMCDMQLPAAALSQCLRFTHLHSLSLLAEELPAGTPDTLRLLCPAALHALACRSVELPAGTVHAICQHLTNLTSLELDSVEPMMELGQLSALCQLRSLTLVERQRRHDGTFMAPPLPSSLPALTAYEFKSDEWLVELAGSLMQQCCLQGSDPAKPLSPAMILMGVHTLPSLSDLLGAALPAGTLCCGLVLLTRELPASAVLQCAQLAVLPTLLLANLGSSSIEPGLAALLPQAPQLSSLILHSISHTGCLPACVAEHAGLRRLCLLKQGLTSLPSGAYLKNLESLELSNNAIQRLPPAICQATALRMLAFENNPALTWTPEDVATLARLPLLSKLVLGLQEGGGAGMPQRVLRALKRSLPRLLVE